jgi:hypothetical protein
LEKERAVTAEKINLLETKKTDLEARYKKDVEDLNISLKGIKENES